MMLQNSKKTKKNLFCVLFLFKFCQLVKFGQKKQCCESISKVF
jgi:hypothetical protein